MAVRVCESVIRVFGGIGGVCDWLYLAIYERTKPKPLE